MTATVTETALRELLDRNAIQDAMARYARAVDRSDWEGVRAAYHPDAYDDHGEFKGSVDDLIPYLQKLLTVQGGMHFLGNCLIEFAGDDLAVVETYFVSQRLRPATDKDVDCGPGDAVCRFGWGRYCDRFERRDGEWRVARRLVVMDAIYSTVARGGGVRGGRAAWGTRDGGDPLHQLRSEVLGTPIP